MTATQIQFTDSQLSWRRAALLANLYWPVLKWCVVVCLVVPIVFYLLAASVGNVATAILSLILFPSSLLPYFAPATLAMRNYRDVAAQLPVTATEKVAFLALTFWVAMPLVVYVGGLLGNLLGGMVFHHSVNDIISNFQKDEMSQLPFVINIVGNGALINVLSLLATTTIFMYFVIVSKRNRVLYGILSYFVTIMVTAFAGIVAVACYTFYKVVYDGKMAIDIIENATAVSIIAVLCVLVIAGVVFFIKLYKYLRNNGF